MTESDIILFDKEEGITSFSSLYSIKRNYPKKTKIGHAGTLDKFASGLMIVLVGSATKLNPVFSSFDKSYLATIKFGEETDTLDPEGRIIKTSSLPTLDEVDTALKKIRGESMQTPPVYSAVHVDGKRAYREARKNHEIEMPQRRICVYDAEKISYSDGILVASFHVSKGTYIRSLARDIAASIGKDLRQRVFERVMSFSSGEMYQFSTASLITRSTNDIQQVQMVSVMLLRMIIYAPILGLGGIIKVSGTRTGMGWIIAVAVAAILVLVLTLVNIAMPKFKIMQKLVDRVNLVSREILTGLLVIRAFSREKFEEKRFDEANANLMKTQLFTNRVMNFMMPVMMLIMNGITVMIVWFGAQGIDAGNLQVGDMMAFMTYTMQIVMSFLMLTMVSVMLPRAGVAADRIEEVLNTEPSIHDDAQILDDRLSSCRGVVSFEDVSFHYPGADGDVLEHISFTAEPGKTTAIIGSTGCGKSTLINLIPRFYDVSSGRITLDGIDIRKISQHRLRELIGLVPQKGILFSGTIASNLKLAGEDRVCDEAMKEAARVAQAEEFISEKTEGYDSPVAQGGTNVSGGQKQRLAIARAIAKNPRVYLFDDSFSALDYRTDARLRRALNQKAAAATVIIVAQRISTILHADQILVLEEGRIAGMGTHEQLLCGCPQYQEIARSQLSESELKGGAAG